MGETKENRKADRAGNALAVPDVRSLREETVKTTKRVPLSISNSLSRRGTSREREEKCRKKEGSWGVKGPTRKRAAIRATTKGQKGQGRGFAPKWPTRLRK